SIHLALKKFLWKGVCYQQLRIKNHALRPVETTLTLHFEADFADIFEVSGMKRKARGQNLDSEVTEDRAILSYQGLDGVVRRTIPEFDPRPASLTAASARLDLSLQPREEATFFLTIVCDRVPSVLRVLRFDEARAEAQTDLERYSAWSCHVS